MLKSKIIESKAGKKVEDVILPEYLPAGLVESWPAPILEILAEIAETSPEKPEEDFIRLCIEHAANTRMTSKHGRAKENTVIPQDLREVLKYIKSCTRDVMYHDYTTLAQESKKRRATAASTAKKAPKQTRSEMIGVGIVTCWLRVLT